MTEDANTYRRPFVELSPGEQTVPVIVNSPHSGRYYPKAFLQASRLSGHSIRKSEDYVVDELVESAVKHGMPVLHAVYPRAYLDVNREPFELDPAMFDGKLPDHVNSHSIRVSSGLGTIARIVSEGENIYSGRLPAAEALGRISQIYRPYHEKLQNLLARTHVEFGCAILLDMHSMPSSGMTNEREARADIVLGDRFGNSCHAKIINHARNAFRDMGFRVEVNKPYAGGFITQHYGRPLNGLHALQIEINRSLYMNEVKIVKNRGFSKMTDALDQFFCQITELDLMGLEGTQPLAAE
ncbi:MAG: N-formylglutamate amidohydrolase [Pseudomonadota bacterium]